MKALNLLALALLPFLSECKKTESEPQISDCLQAKLEDFKKMPEASAIVKILKPDGALFWLVDSYGDGIEDVLNEDCELVCIADCECDGGGSIPLCDGSFLNYSREVIWKK